MTTPIALDVLEQTSQMLGYPPTRRTVPGPYDCPQHHVLLEAHQIGLFNGWHQVLICPQFDGACSYGPFQDTTSIPAPADLPADEDQVPAGPRTVARVRDLGNGMALVEVGGPLTPPPPRDPHEGIVDNHDGTSNWTMRLYRGHDGHDRDGWLPVAVDGGAPEPATLSTFTDGDQAYLSMLIKPAPGRRITLHVACTAPGEDREWMSGDSDRRDQFGNTMFTDLPDPVLVDGVTRHVRVYAEPDTVRTVTFALRPGVHLYPVDDVDLDSSTGYGLTPADVRTYVKDGTVFVDLRVVSAYGGGFDNALQIALVEPGESAGELDEDGGDPDLFLDAGTVSVDGRVMRVLLQYFVD